MNRKAILTLVLTAFVALATLTTQAQERRALGPPLSDALLATLTDELERLEQLTPAGPEDTARPRAYLLLRGLHAEGSPVSAQEAKAMQLPPVRAEVHGTTRSVAALRSDVRTTLSTVSIQDKSGSMSFRVAELWRLVDGEWTCVADGRIFVR